MFRRACLVLLVATACVSHRSIESNVPPEARDRLLEGLAAEARGARGEAERAYLAAITAAPRFVDAHRAFQNLKLAEGFRGDLRAKYRAMLAADPDDPVSIYLYGRLESDVAAQRDACERAVEVAPELYSAWVGVGITSLEQRDPRSATRAFEAAIRVDPNRADAWRGRLRQLERTLGDEARARAAEVATKLRAIDPFDVDATRVLAQRAFDEKRRDQALNDVATLARESADPAAATLLFDFLARNAGSREIVRMRDFFAPLARARAANPEWRRLLAWLEERAGDPKAALALLDAYSTADDDRILALARRRLAISCGDFDRALADVIADRFESGFEFDDDSAEHELRELAKSPLESRRGDSAVAAVDTLYRHGLLELGIAAGSAILREDPSNLHLRVAVDRGVAHRRFVAELAAWFERAYAGGAEERADLDAFERTARRLALDCLGEDVVEPFVVREYPAIGRFLDPDPARGGGLARYLDRFGTFLVAGERLTGGILGYALTRVASSRIEIEGRSVLRVLGEDLEIPSPIEASGGEIAGFALETFIVMNVDRARASALRARRAWEDRASASATAPAVLEDSLDPAADRSERVSMREPGSVVLRTWLRAYGAYLESGGRPEAFAGLTLDAVEAHERAHISDAHEFLPLSKDVPRLVAVFAENSFSPSNVEAWLEGRAQLEAIVHARDPRIALAELLRDLPSRDASPPHSVGYFDMAGQLVELVDDALPNLPDLDPDAVLVQQLDRLDPEVLRGLAGRLIARAR